MKTLKELINKLITEKSKEDEWTSLFETLNKIKEYLKTVGSVAPKELVFREDIANPYQMTTIAPEEFFNYLNTFTKTS